MASLPNPVRLLILYIGLALARAGLVDPKHVRRTTDLAWPRIVTGLARMSKNAVDVAMVGIAVGPVAIAGVGFASPYWGLAFSLGGGLAGGTIALVSQRYGAEAFDELGVAVRASAALVVAVTIPVSAAFWLLPTELISVMTNDARAIELGGTYLKILAFGVPFAGLNLVGSRIYIGADDAWTPMVVRAGGALANIVLSAGFIFGLGMGVAGAAVGTVLSNVVVTAAFAGGLVAGRLPGTPALPVKIDPFGTYLDGETMRDVVKIGLPVVGRNTVWTVAKFPMLAIVGLFGANVVAAYVIARRIWGLMNTPGWGFGLASSSLVGQALGDGDERGAESYARDIVVFSVATYVVAAILVGAFAEPIVRSFVSDPAELSIPVAVSLVYAACVATVAQGVKSAAAGPLDASGDTRWPFYSQMVGMFCCAIPVAYLGATTSLGLFGLYLSFLAETTVPAAINYYRFSTGKWKAISREFRPDAAVADD
ncbi:MATE family efflux transporter [Halorussus amylolyticus]|uniref:MATE family efflux transporter n=1 Tax=Halorussus amylolyticus TaxID=1126242 RepID=UPI00104687C7|nr:MATE family efflux transporter [Halorussus amylolyticus]